MARGGIGRLARAIVFALAAQGVIAAAAPASEPPGVPPPGRRQATDPEARAARRRWALAKMDEMANEARRCPERFTVRRQVEECRAEYERRLRLYNEVYIEASRE